MKKLFLEGYSKNAIAEAFGIRDVAVTGVQTCDLPIFAEALECLPETVTARIKRAEEDMNGT